MTDMNNYLLRLIILTAILLNPWKSEAQLMHPEEGFVFSDTEMPRIDITISPSNLDYLYADPYNNMEYVALFRFTRNDSTEEVADIGLRFIGDTYSREKQKKSFRISFNTFNSGRNFHGIEKMNLNAETHDPSMIRSKLSWKLYRQLGVAGLRSNHVLLYINGAFYGVYINTEHIDEKYVRSRFGTNDGNLYEGRWPADLTYIDENQDSYKLKIDGRRVYKLNINEEWDDYQDLVRFISALNQYSGQQLQEELEQVMNVRQYLKIMAVDVMTGNWDGYMGNMNNYFLYRDQVTGRFEYIPFDLENTFGIDTLGLDWSDRSIYNWHREDRPLYEKILQVEEFKEQYTFYIKRLAEYIISDTLSQEMERWKQLIGPHVALDPYYPLDWGYTTNDFENALSTGWGGHVPYGVQEYAAIRASSALDECIQADAPPSISHARVAPSTGVIELDWVTEDDDPGFTTTLHYRIDGAAWKSRLADAPAEIDQVSGIHTYREVIDSIGDETVVDLYFTAMDQAGQETRYPATYQTVSFPLVSGPLYINEFMASNSSNKMDEFGEYNDWVEIYNPTDSQVWLGDFFLSDNMGVPGKYRFPDKFLNPEGYYLVWLDGTPEQGANHAPFKISKEGEKLRLSERPANGFHIIDSITFSLQVTDVSMGRVIDGEPAWMAFPGPTPGYSNLSTGWKNNPVDYQTLILYPNPVSGGTLYFSRRISGAIYNVMGQKLMELEETERAHVSSFAAGMYIFRPRYGESKKFMVTGE